MGISTSPSGSNGWNGVNGVNGTNKKIDFLPIAPLTPEYSSLKPFPVECLPQILRDYVIETAKSTQTSVDMASVIGLGALTVCLQGKFRIEINSRYHEQLSLFIAVIAKPGERKSSLMDAMTRPLFDYEAEENQRLEPDIKENKKTRDGLKLRIEALQDKILKTGGQKYVEELSEVEDELDSIPEIKEKRYFADDCSSEALIRLLFQNHGVMSVISTEGGIFETMAGKYSSNKANFDVWLKGWCGDPLRVDRIQRTTEYIEHPAISAILSIQPSVLADIMGNDDFTGRGLISRFLFSSPPTMIGHRELMRDAPSIESEQAYHDLIYRLMAIPIPEKVENIGMTDEAFSKIQEFFSSHEKYLVEEGQAILDWASKYVGTVIRIAGIIHLAEGNYGPVTENAVERGIKIGEYFLEHANYAYSLMGTDVSIQKAKIVLAKLKKLNKTDVSRNEIHRKCRSGLFTEKLDSLIPTLELLEEHHYIKIITPEQQGAGRPKDVQIYVNPAVFEKADGTNK